MSFLEVTDLVKHFPTPGDPLQVLRGVNLTAEAGDNMAVVGPSGCGKSTLLHIIGTLESPTSGSVSLHGIDPNELSPRKLAEFRNENIGFVFQEHFLLPQLSALENVLVPALARGSAGRDLTRRAEELLEQAGLSERRNHRPAEMSGGERQRVAVARALLLRPAILLADEPTGNLDQDTAQKIGQLLLDMQQREQTVLICVTHSPELASHFTRTLQLDHGKLVGEMSTPASPGTAKSK